MNRSLIALWMTLAAAVATIVMLSLFWARQRQVNSQERVREILRSQLLPLNDSIQRIVTGYSIDLQRQLDSADLSNLNHCVELSRSPICDAIVVVDRLGHLHFPLDVSSQSKDTQTLIDEALQLLREQGDPRPQPANRSGDSTRLAAEAGPVDAAALKSNSYVVQNEFVVNQAELAQAASVSGRADENRLSNGERRSPLEPQDLSVDSNFGWITWYHRRGMILGFWWHQGEAWRCIHVLPSARWMADIVAALPDTRPAQSSSNVKHAGSEIDGALKQLVDVEGNVIYQWSASPQTEWDQLASGQPAAELSVVAPLEGWRLRIYASSQLCHSLAGDDITAPLWFAILGVSSSLLLGGMWVTVNLNRHLRLAQQRVSFVNQVSHELRTPLTNICMYADLLADSLAVDESAGRVQQERIEVIQNESRRLNRLIGNVLEFARSDSKAKPLKSQSVVLDLIVREVLETFRPRLEAIGFQIAVDLNTPQPRALDVDAVEQILVNLISNAEKYASAGQYLSIETRGAEDQVEVVVRDAGPGVPRHMAQKIFQPFIRVSDRLEDPAGTGIGLTIARELARRHGGDCSLLQTQDGAAFCCRLTAPLASK